MVLSSDSPLNFILQLPSDIICEINSWIKGDFIAWSSTCKALNAYNDSTARASRANHLATLLKLFPRKPWTFKKLLNNPNISITDLFAHYGKRLTRDQIVNKINAHNPLILSSNSHTSIDDVYNNPDICWDGAHVCCNKAINWLDKLYISDRYMDWTIFSSLHEITWDFVQSNPHLYWNLRGLSRNPNMTEEIIGKHLHLHWHWDLLTENPNLSSAFLVKHGGENLDWDFLITRADIDFNFIKSLSRPQDISFICAFGNICWKDVLENPHVDWVYNALSENVNIKITDILQNRDRPWNFGNISDRSDLTWEIVRNNKDLPWDFSRLSSNPVITWDIIISNPWHAWNWDFLSINPSMTWEIIAKNSKKPWNWNLLSENVFNAKF